jgi:hypothetical protein
MYRNDAADRFEPNAANCANVYEVLNKTLSKIAKQIYRAK